MIKTKPILLMMTFLIMVLPVLSSGGEVNLPKTGQTTCYDENGNVIDCTNTGQDGDIQAGVEWPSPRFEDNGDGTVTDNLTGLMWLKDANCFGTKNWQGALNAVADFNTNPGSYGCTDYTANYTDWVLPNIVELESLITSEGPLSSNWLNTQGFTNVQFSYYYWSATTHASNTSSAWSIYMNDGYISFDDKSDNYYVVWPVRGGQSGFAQTWQTGQTTSYAAGDDGNLQRGVSWPAPRFKNNDDGTVTDHLTGLIWVKNANCGGSMHWNDALAYCNNLASGSCGLTDGSVAGDWRLPNRKELLSLVDYSQLAPALLQGHLFDNVIWGHYWSATTGVTASKACWVSMSDGYAAHSSKSYSKYVWPVRGGQVLTISYPDGGESLHKGQGYTITWDSVNVSGNIQIDLYKGETEPGNMIMQLAASTENDGEYLFNPPDSLANGGNYLIRISAENGTIWDFSDSFFSIQDVGSLYRMIPENFLSIGNHWEYQVHITKDEGVPVDWWGTSVWDITQTANISGFNTTILQEVYSIPGEGSDTELTYFYLSPENLAVVREENVLLGDNYYETVRNNDPWETLPIWISDTDNNRHVGHGQYSGYDGEHTWTGYNDYYITYVRQEAITVPAGTFNCIVVSSREDWHDDSGWWGYCNTNAWMSPSVGVIKYEDECWVWNDEEKEGYDEIVLTVELTSTNVQPERVIKAMPWIPLLLLDD